MISALDITNFYFDILNKIGLGIFDNSIGRTFILQFVNILMMVFVLIAIPLLIFETLLMIYAAAHERLDVMKMFLYYLRLHYDIFMYVCDKIWAAIGQSIIDLVSKIVSSVIGLLTLI